MVSTTFESPRYQEGCGYFVDPPFVAKKQDPVCPIITCSIGPRIFHNAYYDVGARINVMSKVVYDKTLGEPLTLADFRMQMADQTSQKPKGIAKDILVKVHDEYIPTYFVILDMGRKEEVPLLLGRTFLNTTNTILHVRSGYAYFHIQGLTI